MQHINTERTKIQTMVAIEGSVNLKHLYKPLTCQCCQFLPWNL